VDRRAESRSAASQPDVTRSGVSLPNVSRPGNVTLVYKPLYRSETAATYAEAP
jgi:hypothetical protein